MIKSYNQVDARKNFTFTFSLFFLQMFYFFYPFQEISLGIKVFKLYYLFFLGSLFTLSVALFYKNYKFNIHLLSFFFPFFLLTILSIFYSVDINSSLYMSSKFAIYILIAINVTILLENDVSVFKKVFKAIIITSLLVSVIFLYKFLIGGISILQNGANMSNIGELSAINVGFGGGRNLMASWLVFTITLPLIYFLINSNKKRNIILTISFVIILIALFLSLSRSSLLALVVFLFLYWLFAKDKKSNYIIRKAFFLLIMMLCLILIFDPFHFRGFLIERFLLLVGSINHHDIDYGVQGRVELWEYAWKSIQENPIFGSGIGSLYHGMSEIGGVHNYHNLFIQFCAQIGIVGLGFFIFWTIILIYVAYKNMIILKNTPYQVLATLIFVNILVYYFKGMFMLQYNDLEIWTLISFSIFLYAETKKRRYNIVQCKVK